MAIIGTQDDEENKMPTSSASPNAHATPWESSSGTPPPVSGGGGGFAGGSGDTGAKGVSTGGASPNPGGGGGFTNLSQYLAVNQGTGATTGQAGLGVVQQAADAAKTAQGDYNTSATNDVGAATSAAGVNQGFVDKINSGTANVDQGVIDSIKGGGYHYSAPNTDNIQSWSQDDLDKAMKTGSDASAWKYGGPSDFSKVGYAGPTSIADVTAQYTGPSSVSDFKGPTAAKQSAAQSANDLATGRANNAQGGQAGVATLLRDAYQQPVYTKGENNLDAFLVGGTPGGQAALAQAPALGKGVSDSYTGIQSALGTAIQKGKDTATATNKTYQDDIDQGVKTSGLTKDAYTKALTDMQQSSKDAQNAAGGVALKASLENSRRIGNKPPVTPPVTPQTATDDTGSKGGGTGSLGGDGVQAIDKGEQGVVNNAINTTKTNILGLKNMPKIVSTENAARPTATDNHTATTARNPLAGMDQTAGQNIADSANALKNAAKSVSVSSLKKAHLAHGGEVPEPSFGMLLAKLRGLR